MLVLGPAANALSGLMCEYGESDEDSDAENDKQTQNDDHGAKDEGMSCILLVSGPSPIKNSFLASTVAHRRPGLVCHLGAKTARRVVYVILLPHIDNIIRELAMKFIFAAQEFISKPWRKTRGKVAATSTTNLFFEAST